MKKFMSFIIAGFLAVAFSAFSPSGKQNADSLYYKDSSGFHIFTGEPCPADTETQCYVNVIGVGRVPLFTAENDNSPYLTWE